MSVRVKLAIAHGRLRDDVKEQQIKTSSEVKQQQPTSQKPPGGSPEGIIIKNSIGLQGTKNYNIVLYERIEKARLPSGLL